MTFHQPDQTNEDYAECTQCGRSLYRSARHTGFKGSLPVISIEYRDLEADSVVCEAAADGEAPV